MSRSLFALSNATCDVISSVIIPIQFVISCVLIFMFVSSKEFNMIIASTAFAYTGLYAHTISHLGSEFTELYKSSSSSAHGCFIFLR